MASVWGKNVLGNLSMDIIKAHSFPRATLPENCSLFGTDNVRGQISEHVFAPNGVYCLYTSTVIAKEFIDIDISGFGRNTDSDM